MPDKNNIRQYQLYDYCMSDMIPLSHPSFFQNTNVLDLCCGRGGGLKFLKSNYFLNQAVGIDNSAHQIQKC
jgi:cyclopropane fatty-acyl-phospholipid synthase-like methyltransferase